MRQDWITTQEAAQISGYHAEHIRELLRENRVRAQKFGPVWQIDRASLLAYVQNAKKLGAKRGPKVET